MTRKRSKYRPRPVLQDPLTHVLQNFIPMVHAKEATTNLKTKNHLALSLLQSGLGTAQDLTTLRSAFRIAEALSQLTYQGQYLEEIRAAQRAVQQAASRLRPLFTGPELTQINHAMEVHDAQLEVTTIGELDKAIERIAHGKNNH